MRGKLLVIGLLIFVAAFAAALWWFQTRAYYQRVSGVESVVAQGAVLPLAAYDGIDATTSPLKLRACFRLSAEAARAAAALPAAPDAEPLVAPSWFDCFDAETISRDIESGAAAAIAAARDEPEGFDLMIAVYPDGRGYMWRQLNARFKE